MFDGDFTFINEEFYAEHVSSEHLDSLLADGWRHFGTHFFRYNLGLSELDIRYVIPLRIRLAGFSFSKSQRRTLSRNCDLEISIDPIEIGSESRELFARHKTRFRYGIPDSIYNFLSDDGAVVPTEGKQISVREDNSLIAASYFDMGAVSVSGIYATFDPAFSARRLGIFTLLKEIEYAIKREKEFYYLGYSYAGNSFYDYKKRFRASEFFNWKGKWEKFANTD